MVANGHITLEEIRKARKKKLKIVMLSVFADDSSDEKCESIFAIAGIMGTEEEWDAFEVNWVRITGGKIFHATDCESGYADYKNIPHKQRLLEYKNLIKLLTQSNMMGIGVAVDIEAFRHYLSNALEDGPYYNCFMRTISFFVKLASLIIPQQKVRFTFDINHKTQYNAAFLYNNYLINHKDLKEALFADEIGFATSKAVGIQVADLFARETMKYFYNRLGSDTRPVRLSIYELLKTNRFKCYCYDKGYFKNLKKHIEAFKKNYDMKEHEDYNKWLLKHKRLDNTENRTKFLIYLESMKDLGA